jgi:beta-mannosidase
MTAAAALRAAGRWSLDGPPRRFDAEDWWWRTRVTGPGVLVLGGIATVADVLLDGAVVLRSESMFLRHRLDLPPGEHELRIHCHALDPLLAQRRPRPRWRAPMVENQQLRWFRTTLLGRTPGWSPPAAPVGPWRGVELGEPVPRPRAWLEGDTGVVEADGEIEVAGVRGLGRVELPRPRRWWPHTHGAPELYPVRVNGRDAGRVGFRTVERDEPFALRVNGVRTFCRGACWTPLDPVALSVDAATTRAALSEVRAAGLNMVRVGGTMVYESDAFLDACDELGILVWQDFMFANLDYPTELSATVEEEARQELARWHGRPALAVLCGNSEGEQQAAMWGAGRAAWRMPLFDDTLAAVAHKARPDVPYWPSSAHGGPFPHVANQGTTSYYGVGAYQRPLEDARRAEVRFATECLAFANVGRGRGARGRVPRDLGVGWDFDDVRDHYLGLLYGVDPAALRYADLERYLALGRVATGEVMAATLGEWRRARSTCAGALIWFLRDLWLCDGWGLLEADGTPKAAWRFVARAAAPLAVHISDEGGNGLALHVVNDGAAARAGELTLELWRSGEVRVGGGARALEVPAHGALEVPAADLLEGFADLSYAYRFGPPSCDLVVARFAGAEAFHFPVGRPAGRELDLGLTATLEGDELVVRTRRFAQAVAIDAPGCVPDDDFFHLAPGAERRIRLVRRTDKPVRGSVQALNAESATPIIT